MSRCDSAAIVAKTSELLPEPETPVKAVSRRFGISTLTSLRLFSRAPWTRIRSWLSATCSAGDRVSVIVTMLTLSPPLVDRASTRGRALLSSAHRLLYERGDPGLVGGGQLRQREGGRPH